MIAISGRARLEGTVTAPASKSHTIRGVVLGGLADGKSELVRPLVSQDTLSAVAAMHVFGARVHTGEDTWHIEGVGGTPRIPDTVVDTGNSGTTLYMAAGTAALVDGWTVLTGDGQIRRRTATPLLDALAGLGVTAVSTRNNGCAPLVIKGPLEGGETCVVGLSSQYVSSLLMAAPFAPEATTITVTRLNERPYVRMTLDWLRDVGVDVDASDDLATFTLAGNQRYGGFSRRIPGDYSSATFLLCAAALCGGTVRMAGLDRNDPQGDKQVIDILKTMGADVRLKPDAVEVTGGSLHGADIDMNAIPDALPMLAVTACFAEGTTTLGNVPQARHKETDRIAVMAAELKKLGADITELPDGLVIRGSGLTGGMVDGHGDHRVVMALTVGGCAADGPVSVTGAEAVTITFPEFWDTMRSLGADITIQQ